MTFAEAPRDVVGEESFLPSFVPLRNELTSILGVDPIEIQLGGLHLPPKRPTGSKFFQLRFRVCSGLFQSLRSSAS